MSFDSRDIRLGMDVYTLDGVYLGTVRRVWPGPPSLDPVPTASAEASVPHGELLGPMPTAPLGNTAPCVQGAAAGFGSAADDAAPLGHGAIEVGRWWGLLGRRTIPLDAVQTVSLERVVLEFTSAASDELFG
jgi:hypothetical protein